MLYEILTILLESNILIKQTTKLLKHEATQAPCKPNNGMRRALVSKQTAAPAKVVTNKNFVLREAV